MRLSRAVPLRHRLFVQFLVSSLLPLTLVVLIAAVVMVQDVVRTVEANNAALALAVRDQLESRLGMRQRAVELLAAMLLRQRGTADLEQAHMSDMMGGDPYLESLYITDTNGVVERVVLSAACSTRAADLLGVDLASRPFYQASRRSLAPVRWRCLRGHEPWWPNCRCRR